MRLKINLETKKNYCIPFNYNHGLSNAIYKNIQDTDYATKLHQQENFKYFNFSRINVKRRKITPKGIITKDGKLYFEITSPNKELIKKLVGGYLDNLKINLYGEELNIETVELLKQPTFKDTAKFITASPIIARTKKEINGTIKTWDLAPGDQFFKQLENNLIKKYNSFYELKKTDKNIKISSGMRSVKRKRIQVIKQHKPIYHRAYEMDTMLSGDPEIIEFAYDVGIGEKNSMGFGMLNIDNKN